MYKVHNQILHKNFLRAFESKTEKNKGNQRIPIRTAKMCGFLSEKCKKTVDICAILFYSF